MGIVIGAKHASVVWRVSVSRSVRYGRLHYQMHMHMHACICNNMFMLELWK